jgi:hypothetical protein
MAQPTNSSGSSGSLALSRRPRSSRERWAAPVEYNDSRALPKTVSGHRTLGAAGVAPLPVKPAEVAQARVFEGLLQAECAELHELAHRMPGAADQQPDNPSLTWDLMQIRARIDEVQRLLQALRGRFPHTLPESDRPSV